MGCEYMSFYIGHGQYIKNVVKIERSQRTVNWTTNNNQIQKNTQRQIKHNKILAGTGGISWLHSVKLKWGGNIIDKWFKSSVEHTCERPEVQSPKRQHKSKKIK